MGTPGRVYTGMTTPRIRVPWIDPATLRAMSPRAVHALIVVAAAADRRGRLHAPLGEIARLTCASESTARRALRELVDAGVVDESAPDGRGHRVHVRYTRRFTFLGATVQDISGLPPLAAAAMLWLARATNTRTGELRMRVSTLASHLRACPRAVRYALSALRRAGLVTWVRTGRSSIFSVLAPPPTPHEMRAAPAKECPALRRVAKEIGVSFDAWTSIIGSFAEGAVMAAIDMVEMRRVQDVDRYLINALRRWFEPPPPRRGVWRLTT